MTHCGVGIGLILLVWAASMTAAPHPREQERRNDQRMWQLMRQMLVDFGYSNKVEGLDRAWAMTMTPQQWASLDWPEPTQQWERVSLMTERVASVCGQLPRPDLGLALQQACAQTTDAGQIIHGLLLWTQRGGQPVLQSRTDLALHFLSAAVFEYHAGAGRLASLAKEELDQEQGKPYDLDDLAAGLAGATWVGRARTDTNWVARWATGQLSLDRQLPPLRYGHGAPAPSVLAQLSRDVHNAINSSPTPPAAAAAVTPVVNPKTQQPQ